jgi:TRAP-type C4-dicarboxylate transport system permease large subunit
MRSILHNWLFWAVTIPWALFYGIFCFTIFLWSKKKDYDPKIRQERVFRTREELKKNKWPWILHQFWFNALGVFIGWMVIFYALEGNIAPTDKRGLFLWIVGFIGITGKERAKKQKALEELEELRARAHGSAQT